MWHLFSLWYLYCIFSLLFSYWVYGDLYSPSLYQTSEAWILLLSLVVKSLGQMSKLQPFSIQLHIWQHQLYPASLRQISSRDLVTHNWSAWQPLVPSSFFTVNSVYSLYYRSKENSQNKKHLHTEVSTVEAFFFVCNCWCAPGSHQTDGL